jgi:hypothetical protein
MKTTVDKFFNDYEKEENWINSMAAKGWNLTNASPPTYTYEEGIPGEYIYRIALLEHGKTHPDTIEHIRFLEETGAEHVSSVYNWVYFRRKSTEGPFEIYTDALSQIQHYKRMINLLGGVVIGMLIGAATQIPFIIWILFIRNSLWGLANVFTAALLVTFASWVYRPWMRFRKRAKELQQEREIFE